MLEFITGSGLLSPTALFTAVISIIVLVFSKISRSRQGTLSNFPTAGKLDWRITTQLAEGVQKYPDRAVRFSGPLFDKIIFPARYANEIKDIPESTASFEQQLHREFAGSFTGIGTYHKEMTVNLQDLNRHNTRVLELLQGEIPLTLEVVIGPCKEPVAFPAAFHVLRIIAQLAGRVFVGLPLARDLHWIKMNIEFLSDSFKAAAKLTKYPVWIRPAVAWWSTEGRTMRKHKAEAVRLLKPIIEQRISDLGNSTHEEKPIDMIQWTLENQGAKARTVEEHMEIQLALLSVSLLGTTILTTYILYELAAHPECVFELRKEIEDYCGDTGGGLDRNSLHKLRKLDSFIKETQRMNVTSAVMLSRKIRRDTTLSDGTFLPAGSDIGVNAMEVNRSDEIWVDPDSFDGFRFEKLRNQPGNENRHQLVKADNNQLNFGLGNQVCPGRFFAGTEMKVIVSEIISKYDIAFHDEAMKLASGKFTVEDVFVKPKLLVFKARGLS